MGSLKDTGSNHHTNGDANNLQLDTRYEIKRATTLQDFELFMPVLWAANHTPYDPIITLFFPSHPSNPSSLTTALKESITRFYTEHCAQKGSSSWYYILSRTTNEVVGCAQWVTHRQNPFPDGVPKLEAPWWPEGSLGREFCESILNQVYKPRACWMTRPHLALSWMCVHPSHRRRGIGSLLMREGVQRADELGVEAWIEASSMGKPLYAKFGFRALFKMCYDMEKEGAGDEWRRLEHELTPPPFWAMWRPTRGVWEIEGEGGRKKGVKMPWELGRDDRVIEINVKSGLVENERNGDGSQR